MPSHLAPNNEGSFGIAKLSKGFGSRSQHFCTEIRQSCIESKMAHILGRYGYAREQAYFKTEQVRSSLIPKLMSGRKAAAWEGV